MKENSNQNFKEEDLVLNVVELSRYLKISKSKAYQTVKSKDFPTVKLGKRILIPIEPLKEWLNSRTSS